MGRGSGRHVGIWGTFESVHHIRELNSIPDEKDREIVSNQVVVAILRIELDSKTPGVSHCIRRAPPSGDGGKAHEHRGLFRRVLKECRLGLRLNAIVNLEVAMCSSPLGMDNPLGNAFPVKMSHLLNKLDIL